MDIISLGKASKVLRQIKEVDEDIVAKKAESRFVNVDARLDWIEQQASNIMAQNSLEVDLTRKTFSDTNNVNGSVQLKELAPGAYVGSGTWESDVIDLGEGWQKSNSITISKTMV
jgi:hypothetical protein